MSSQDKTIQCSDCGQTFTYTTEQQEYFTSKGYLNEPKRCSWCRAAKKMQRSGDGDYSYRARSWR